MKKVTILVGLLLLVLALGAAGAPPVSLYSPGLPPSHMDDKGQLVEDWGTVGVKVAGEGVVAGPTTIEATRLEGLIPAARAASTRGAVKLTWTAYRAPVFPAGVDVLTVRVEEARNQRASVTVGLEGPSAAQIGLRSVKVDKRTVLTLPLETLEGQERRPWGWFDDATALPNWAKPEGPCDPAFRHIRAGLGGVPIRYRFTVAPKSRADVVLGFCESHWAQPGQRPLLCLVEGAAPQIVDPVDLWGQHKPGALLFKARDADGDGQLEVTVRPAPGAADRNPILNAIWIFPPNKSPELARVISGSASGKAVHYVGVGGPKDQSLYPSGKLEYRVNLPAGGSKEFVFLVACQGGSAPLPEAATWTGNSLRQAALAVWRDWPAEKKLLKPE